VRTEPERFFKPPTSARGVFSGWLGVFLDAPGNKKVRWGEISTILDDAFRLVAPRSLVVALDRT